MENTGFSMSFVFSILYICKIKKKLQKSKIT